MISEQKIMSLYSQAVDQGHPDPKRAVFGRLAMTDAQLDYDKDGQIGLFGVAKRKASKIGLSTLDNVDDSFNAMMYWDTRHINESADVNEGLARTVGRKDVDGYRKELDKALEKYSEDKLIHEGGEVVGIRQPEENLADPLDGAEGIEEVKETAKRVVAENAAESQRQTMMGLIPDANAEYMRLESLLKATIKEFANN